MKSVKVKSGETFESLWTEIEIGVKEIHDGVPMNRERYINLYSKIYSFCVTRPQGNSFPVPVESVENDQLCKTRLKTDAAAADESCILGFNNPQMYFVGRKLYANLETLLKNILQTKLHILTQLSGFELLKKYSADWDQFQASSRKVNKIFNYLNRHWIHHGPGENREPSKVYQIYQLAMDAWKEIMSGSKEVIITAILDEYRKDRVENTNDEANKKILKNVITSFLKLGQTCEIQTENAFLTDSWTGLKLDPNYYITEIESVLIPASKEHFTKLAHDYLEIHNDFAKYLKMADDELSKEQERTCFFLPPLSFQKLFNVSKEALIQNHLDQFKVEFKLFLVHERIEDINRTIRLVRSLVDGKEILAQFFDIFTGHVAEFGKNVVLKLANEVETVDPKRLVDAILEVHTKYRAWISEEFDNSMAMGFQSALDKACVLFVNHNALTQGSGCTSQKAAELLSRFCDSVLKKLGNSVVDEKTIDDIMTVFTYLTDKDAFEAYYTIKLANRLVNQMSSNDEAEEMLISRLAINNGLDYTSKMTRMYKDMEISRDHYTVFKLYLTDQKISLTYDFQPLILTSGFWPFKFPTITFDLPRDLEPPIQAFIEFYNFHHNGRKLIWLYNRSKGEIKTNCFASSHIFQLSVFQMAILLMYNTSDQYRLEDIIETTKLSTEFALQVLETLTSANVLICVKSDSSASSTETIYKLNLDYKFRKFRVIFPNILQSEQKVEKDKSEDMIKEGRKLCVQATIVRLMKKYQTKCHKDLELDVMKQTHNQFHPNSGLIRHCIEILIEKEYIKRSTTEADTYVYIS